MSVQAMAWAIEQQQVTDSTARHVLLVLANYADKEGRHAFPSASSIARDTGLSIRAVRMKLVDLQEAGAIGLGNQAIVAAHIERADKRPVVYNLCITGVQPVHPDPTGCNLGVNGVHLTTARGEPRAPKPSLTLKATSEPGIYSRQQQQGEASGKLQTAQEALAKSRITKPASPEAVAAAAAAVRGH